MKAHYETDTPDAYPDAVQIDGQGKIAWYVLGWETEPDADTEWTSIEERTGNLVCVMVGDDKHFIFEPSDIMPLAREDFCGVCGQIGCTHDGYDRD